MSQKAAARHWHVAYSTLCALEQGKDRNYQSHTLAQFDVMLGVDTWALYSQADVEPAISWNQIDDLRAELAELRAELEAIRVVPAPTGLEALQGELTAAERADLVSFAHWLIARRRPHNGS